MIINALPQYEVIQDSIKSFIQRRYNKDDTLSSYFPKVQKSKIHTLMLKDLHKSIEERLTQEVSEIKWIDVWNNQFSHEGKEYPFPLPACFISLNRIDFLQDNGIKSANVEIKLHLGQEVYLDTFRKSEHKDLAFTRYDLIDKICEVLEEYQNDSHSPMELGAVDLDDNHSSLMKNVITVYATYTSCG